MGDWGRRVTQLALHNLLLRSRRCAASPRAGETLREVEHGFVSRKKLALERARERRRGCLFAAGC